MEKLLSLKDVCSRTGLAPWTIHRLLTYGGMPDVPRVGGRRVFTEGDVERIVAAAEKGGSRESRK